MTARAAAGRYARALFDVVLAERIDPQVVAGSLAGFVELMEGHEALGRALTHPAIPASRKAAVLRQVLAQAGPLPGPLAKLLVLLAERDRLGLVRDLSQAFERRLMDHQKIVRAEVTTAVALPPDRVSALRDGLARTTGREVRLETQVDPSIVGGAVARIGSTVYDGSVTRQLTRLRETLAGAAD
ncbi:MAG TPA: ATP synthase F1 subunit delta [Vicinamibacterales bacterium]|nr:ATP synthase F1 subunit delta [Vicinamibacterales bacterium]